MGACRKREKGARVDVGVIQHPVGDVAGAVHDVQHNPDGKGVIGVRCGGEMMGWCMRGGEKGTRVDVGVVHPLDNVAGTMHDVP